MSTTDLNPDVEAMRARKDAAYLERNKVVAALAKCFPSGTARTSIENWSEDWFGCVYIDLPTGQVSWHFHDSHEDLFKDLPKYPGVWDGHTTEEKYERLARLEPQMLDSEAYRKLLEELDKVRLEVQQKKTVKYGAVISDGAVVLCEEHDREPCPHDPARRCDSCPGSPNSSHSVQNDMDWAHGLKNGAAVQCLISLGYEWSGISWDKPKESVSLQCWLNPQEKCVYPTRCKPTTEERAGKCSRNDTTASSGVSEDLFQVAKEMRENAQRLRKFPGSELEARARILAAANVEELATFYQNHNDLVKQNASSESSLLLRCRAVLNQSASWSTSDSDLKERYRLLMEVDAFLTSVKNVPQPTQINPSPPLYADD